MDKFARERTAGVLQEPVVGTVLQPKDAASAVMTDANRQKLSQEMSKLTGTGSGRVYIGDGRFDVKEIQGVAHRYDHSVIYSLVEARVAAQLGVPPSVSQMGAGLAQTKVGATLEHEIKLAYENGAIPLAEKLGEEWTNQLLPKLNYGNLTVRFDVDSIDYLTEDDKTTKIETQLMLVDGEYVEKEEVEEMIRSLVGLNKKS